MRTRSKIEWRPQPTPSGPSTAEFYGEHRGFAVELWEDGFMWIWAVFEAGEIVANGGTLLRSDAERSLTKYIDRYPSKEES